ncbi:Vacuolar membrane amino acid uptake transporter fnx2 [Lachnellula arida]|uniref:Vacuolar membrane amino acid uptake transporter fnx2 n=1 Tax=Lachnellula arida TaxID=1316785 RepID=A0A8T9BG29_9HELO|nr:Vacuolar membrane amino acid uptake transporter fnx2 [Lachnellula arida]
MVSTSDETTPLIPEAGIGSQTSQAEQNTNIEDGSIREGQSPKEDLPKSKIGIIAVLLVGVFIANSDGSLVLATYGKISSDFNDLESGRWLLTASLLASCAAQPLYGKISNIFGRKHVLLTAYSIFGLGCIISGSGHSMTQIIIGRVVGGAGGAGMVSLVSILISDLVSLKDVASYRSYVNVVQTTGRSIGGPLGGYIAQTLGWRWPFYSEFPVVLLAIILVAWKLEVPKREGHIEESPWKKLKRIDFVGSAFLSVSIIACLLALNFFSNAESWSSLVPIILAVVAILLMIAFCLVEKFWAKEPIFPLQLLTKLDTCTSYVILACQMAAQLGMMSSVPLYFQVTKRAKSGEAGAYLVPAVVGNTVGGLITGAYINRSGRYKLPIVLSGGLAAIAYTLLIVRWRGHTKIWESLYVFPGGLGTGIAYSAVFIALAASVTEDEMAIAGTGLYTSGGIGSVIGISVSGAVFQWWTKKGLENALNGVENGLEIAQRALSDVGYVNNLEGYIHGLVVDGYLTGFRAAFLVSLIFSASSFTVSLLVREHNLRS